MSSEAIKPSQGASSSSTSSASSSGSSSGSSSASSSGRSSGSSPASISSRGSGSSSRGTGSSSQFSSYFKKPSGNTSLASFGGKMPIGLTTRPSAKNTPVRLASNENPVRPVSDENPAPETVHVENKTRDFSPNSKKVVEWSENGITDRKNWTENNLGADGNSFYMREPNTREDGTSARYFQQRTADGFRTGSYESDADKQFTGGFFQEYDKAGKGTAYYRLSPGENGATNYEKFDTTGKDDDYKPASTDEPIGKGSWAAADLIPHTQKVKGADGSTDYGSGNGFLPTAFAHPSEKSPAQESPTTAAGPESLPPFTSQAGYQKAFNDLSSPTQGALQDALKTANIPGGDEVNEANLSFTQSAFTTLKEFQDKVMTQDGGFNLGTSPTGLYLNYGIDGEAFLQKLLELKASQQPGPST